MFLTFDPLIISVNLPSSGLCWMDDEMRLKRLAWAAMCAGQRGMDDWRRTGTCDGGNVKRKWRRRRGRLRLRRWRHGNPECLG